MLKRLGQFSDYQVLRTRDSAALEKCDIVVDVGGVYDHSKKRYDHHQKGFNETMQSLGVLDFNTKLSSAGLIYAHYGRQLIAEILGLSHEDKIVGVFYRRLYEVFVECVDAIDNGISQYDGTPRYYLYGSLCSRVGNLNPHWNEIDAVPDERFQKAIELIGGEFESNVSYLANVWWPAREIVEKAIDESQEIDSSGKIVYISCNGVPWKEHFFQIEEEKGLKSREMTFVVFVDSTSKEYRVQAIPKNSRSCFESRMNLPSSWRALRDAQLIEASGIPGCTFVHATGFIGGNRTLEGALDMARKALELADPKIEGEHQSEIESKKAKIDSPLEENSQTVQTFVF